MRVFIPFIFLIILFSCNQKHRENSINLQQPKVVEAKGYVVPKDSIQPPVVIKIDESKLKKIPVGKPKVIPIKTNSYPASKPKVVLAGKPRICIPGQDSFLLPKTVFVTDSPFTAGDPKIVIAKDYQIRDQNPFTFGILNKLQGLKHGTVNCILEDTKGRLWFGTDGGGVSCFDGKSLRQYTTIEGLSSNRIWSIYQDHNENIWFGTFEGGIVKYNGTQFTIFNTKDGLSNNSVWAIAEDKSGNLWFGTDGGGVSKFDGKKFTNYNVNTGLCSNLILSILVDRSGGIWFGTDAGLSKFDGKLFTTYTENNGLPCTKIYTIAEDNSGALWLGTNGCGAVKFNGLYFEYYTKEQGLLGNRIKNILIDKEQNFWFSTLENGLFAFDGFTFSNYTTQEGLSSNFIRCAIQDRGGRIWLGTVGGGVVTFKNNSFYHFLNNNDITDISIRGITEDSQGNIWFATNGSGLFKYNWKYFEQYSVTEGLPSNFLFSLQCDGNGNIWIGSDGKGMMKFDGTNLVCYGELNDLLDGRIWAIHEDSKGNVWFGTDGEGLLKFDGHQFVNYTVENGISRNKVLSIYEDKSRSLWFGTDGGGITKMNGASFTHYTKKNGLANEVILSIAQDSLNNLWLGSESGVMLYNGKRFTTIDESNGLLNNHILNLKVDKTGNIWIGTRLGMNCVSKKNIETFTKDQVSKIHPIELPTKSFSFDDGFLGIGVNKGNTLFNDDSGKLWIGANDRLTTLNLQNINTDTIVPNVQITSINLFNEPVSWSFLKDHKDSIILLNNGTSLNSCSFNNISRWYGLPLNLSLAHNNNSLTFNFIGITMNQPKKVKYQYKLEGMDENWSGLTSRNDATYGNIPPGTYTFLVKAMNSDGYWSKPFAYTFTIRPPWWKTWWAYSAYAILILGSIFSYTRWRERTLRARQKELEVKVDEATEVIRKQKDEVEHQKEKVEEKNREILDSIEYAKRIQTAILPPARVVKEFLKNSFILYIPKDIVAGDFYWMENVDDTIYFASCDCTGHGVPGAMVSVVCNTALNRAVIEFGLRKTGEIFDKTRELVLENFAKSDEEVKDGMDASLAALDLINQKMMWSGANNPLWIYRKNNNQIEEIKADKQPIGQSDKPKPFATTNIDLCEGDIIYLFTDGYSDQFGGEKNKKLTKAKFRELLLGLASLSMDEQRTKLLDFHNTYRGSNEQVDDICVMGVRV